MMTPTSPDLTILELIEQMADRLEAAGLSFSDGFGQGTTEAINDYFLLLVLNAVVLAAFTVIAVAKEWQALSASAASIGGVVLAFNLLSLLSGYYLSRALGLAQPMATAISYEIGIHNSTLAIYIALSVLKDFQMALPAAMYSVSMYIVGALFGLLVLRRSAGTGAVLQQGGR